MGSMKEIMSQTENRFSSPDFQTKSLALGTLPSPLSVPNQGPPTSPTTSPSPSQSTTSSLAGDISGIRPSQQPTSQPEQPQNAYWGKPSSQWAAPPSGYNYAPPQDYGVQNTPGWSPPLVAASQTSYTPPPQQSAPAQQQASLSQDIFNIPYAPPPQQQQQSQYVWRKNAQGGYDTYNAQTGQIYYFPDMNSAIAAAGPKPTSTAPNTMTSLPNMMAPPNSTNQPPQGAQPNSSLQWLLPGPHDYTKDPYLFPAG